MLYQLHIRTYYGANNKMEELNLRLQFKVEDLLD
jgi:hypothetical protein